MKDTLLPRHGLGVLACQPIELSVSRQGCHVMLESFLVDHDVIGGEIPHIRELSGTGHDHAQFRRGIVLLRQRLVAFLHNQGTVPMVVAFPTRRP